MTRLRLIPETPLIPCPEFLEVLPLPLEDRRRQQLLHQARHRLFTHALQESEHGGGG